VAGIIAMKLFYRVIDVKRRLPILLHFIGIDVRNGLSTCRSGSSFYHAVEENGRCYHKFKEGSKFTLIT